MVIEQDHKIIDILDVTVSTGCGQWICFASGVGVAVYLFQGPPDQTGSEKALTSLRRDSKLLKSLHEKEVLLKKELDALKEKKECRSALIRHGQATPEILKELGFGDALGKTIEAAEKRHAPAAEAVFKQWMLFLEELKAFAKRYGMASGFRAIWALAKESIGK
ncbi:hypothetical protein KFL_003790070 [Klebsormidium nitens]|uniref:Uncharacterized protein n=1 Tax=Klebsormidium nitens TaxID=105231 RepID=A0A1Y1IEH2_KLENI|nr:hypothetical protein KFL_003790070 [Klebsormidium nitens]|eukprot:GAQ87819.1 hypothetical protein KFL_003790070 [Klebsormidium nitens]